MNYEDMSDYEINKSVLIVEDLEGDVESITCRNTKLKCINSVAIVKFKGIDETANFNPCNNPSDAWPIITKNHIHICFGSVLATAKVFTCTELIEVVDKNPLKAAMICFLKMKDAEK